VRNQASQWFRPRVEALEDRRLLAAPVLDPIANVSVPAGKSLIIPMTAGDADGDTLTYTVTSSSPQITTRLHTGNPYLRTLSCSATWPRKRSP
jgi:hypothetical protein